MASTGDWSAVVLTSAEFTKLRRDVLRYARDHNGRIYAPICHPAFSDIPSHHGHERFEAIQKHLPEDSRTALDIGAHWGYFCHRLEHAGLNVTAVESNEDYLSFLYRIRELCDRHFTIVADSVFNMVDYRYDVVLGLNIFHHFIKQPEMHEDFVGLLRKLDCRSLFFQAHNPQEGQMRGAYRNYSPDEFAEFLSVHAHLPNTTRIGEFGARPMYLLAK